MSRAQTGSPTVRQLRADARRNRQHVLEAARTLIAARGLSAPIDEIARCAGVGVGTVYRHFPTKETLYEAIVVAHLEQLRDLAGSLASAAEPGAAFFDFLLRAVESARQKRDLTEALSGAGIDLNERAAGIFCELRSAAEVLLDRAQEVGAVREDVGVDDLWSLLGATCCEQSDRSARLLRLVCDGLRPPRC